MSFHPGRVGGDVTIMGLVELPFEPISDAELPKLKTTDAPI